MNKSVPPASVSESNLCFLNSPGSLKVPELSAKSPYFAVDQWLVQLLHISAAFSIWRRPVKNTLLVVTSAFFLVKLWWSPSAA